MTNRSFLWLIVALFLVSGIRAQEVGKQPYMKTEGLSHPESVVIDRDRQVFYVSNMAERSSGDGFISRISSGGKILDLKWIEGLNDPKGLLVQNEKLFVTDNTELVEIDILSGKVIKKWKLPKASGLNDIAAGDAGQLFISDIRKNSIFRIDPSGAIEEWLHDENLEQPNGLLVVDNDIYVSAWGKDQPGNFLKVDRKTKNIQKISREGIGNLDGVQAVDENTFYISDWATGKIYSIQTSGEQEEILTSAKSAGDILYLEKENELVLPMNHQNSLWWYRL